MYYWPERKRNRLENYDYSSVWYYFVTMCTKWRISYFWEILNFEMILNEYGKIACEEIFKTQELRNEISIDSFVIMPNHLHIIMIVKNMDIWNQPNVVGDAGLRPLRDERDITKNNISNAIQRIKSWITRNIRQKFFDYEFAWQRSFYDRIIRNEYALLKARIYIQENPEKWKEDVNNIKFNRIKL